MTLLIVSFLAGVLTVAAPCVLPLLPVVVGGSLVPDDGPKPGWRRPLIIAASLGLSVILFSLLLKATTTLLGVPVMVWQAISSVIVILLGLNWLWPGLWDKLAIKLGLANRSNHWLAAAGQRRGLIRDILTGSALGPVFASCSPTYALIVASILPASFIKGFSYLLAYAAGLGLTLMLIALLGQTLVRRLGWLANPHGYFKRIIGVLFIAVGIMVLFGFDKDIQAYVIDRGWYQPVSDLELKLR